MLITIVDEDITDTFPEFYKRAFKLKPGYETWRYLFKNEIQKKIENFVNRYAAYN